MARVTYTTEQLRKRGISIVKDQSIMMDLAKDRTGDELIKLYKETGIAFAEPDTKIWVFNITPIPAPRMTQGQIKFLHIHDGALSRQDLATKRRIKNYFAYKDAVLALSRKIRFAMPESGFHIKFFLPHRLQRPELEGTPHQQKPDTDNMLKAFKDALCSRDQAIWDYRVTKLWCCGKLGRIEVTLI